MTIVFYMQLLLEVKSKLGEMALDLQDVRHNQHLMNARINTLAGVSNRENENDLGGEIENIHYRKRLKERMWKQALQSGTLRTANNTWQKYLFGICPEDRRMGKQGSR